MNFPAGGTAIVSALWAKHSVLAFGSEDQRRELTLKIAETFCAHYGPDWGTKSTYESYPQSKDAIAFRYSDGTIAVFDWQNGTSREVSVQDGQAPSYDHLAQFFRAVSPVDHLADGQTAPPPPPAPPAVPTPPAVGVPAWVTRLHKLIDSLAQYGDAIDVTLMVTLK
jgi:hypothetical protein